MNPATESTARRPWHAAEDAFSSILLTLMVILPVGAISWRWATGESMAAVNLWVQALNLWIAFTGGMLAARAGTHLALSTGTVFGISGRAKVIIDAFTGAVGAAVSALLAYGSFQLLLAERGSSNELAGGVPMWVVQGIMPLGFFGMALRLAWHGGSTLQGRLGSLVGVLLVSALALVPVGAREPVVWIGGALLLAGVGLGTPLYAGMGGMAMLLFYGSPIPVSTSAVPAETFRIVADPTLASLPLFTLAGYLLAEGGSSKRLVHLFQTWFGWLPGGVAAATVLVCAFFTTFTGASGVTILALGGLLLPALLNAGYSQRFSIGLIAAAGSIGLLFPPSLPVILYGVTAHVPIPDLFIGGLIPGTFLVLSLVGMAVVVSLRSPRPAADAPAPLGDRVRGRALDMVRAAWASKFELVLPLLVLGGIFGGFVTLFEAAAITAAYAFVIEVVIHRDLHPFRDVPRVMVECVTLIGGVFVILGVALGFTSYLVDAEIPLVVRDFVQANVANRIMFLLLLNLLLVLVGCLMDIYSAIMVVVPLILPVAAVFDVHPVHLGIIFLANLELGYLTPPVGLNLFLASFRFKVPLTDVYRFALPFLGVMTFGVLVITYAPAATTWGLDESSGEPPPDFFEDEPAAPADGPKPLSADELQRLLEEDGDAPTDPTQTPTGAGAAPEGATAPSAPPEGGAPPKLDMNAVFDELEAE
jgi:tripartite ATP-independent transporter DctM subunit